MNGRLACTCCTPLVDSELLSCHHRGFSLENNTPSTKKKRLQMHVKVACACCRPLVDLERLICYHRSLSSLGKQQTLQLRKMLQMNGRLACTCCTPLVDSELLSCHHHGFSLENDTPSTKKKKAADACQSGLCLLQALSGLGTGQLSPP